METLIDWLLTAGVWTLRNSLESCVSIGLVAGIHWVGRGCLADGRAGDFGAARVQPAGLGGRDVKGGYVRGATDELGAEAVDGVRNLPTSMLHLLGLNHRRLTYRYAGRNFRLTDSEGRCAADIQAELEVCLKTNV